MSTNAIIDLLVAIVSGGGIGSVVTYFGTRRQRKNSFLGEMQDSIDLLCKKNEELMSQVVKLREQNIELLANQAAMRSELEYLRVLYERETGKPAPQSRKRKEAV